MGKVKKIKQIKKKLHAHPEYKNKKNSHIKLKKKMEQEIKCWIWKVWIEIKSCQWCGWR